MEAAVPKQIIDMLPDWYYNNTYPQDGVLHWVSVNSDYKLTDLSSLRSQQTKCQNILIMLTFCLMTFVTLLGLQMNGLKAYWNYFGPEMLNIGIISCYVLLLLWMASILTFFLEWVNVIQMARCSHSLHEIKSLLKEFTEISDKWSRVYGYHVLNHRYEFVTGKVKCYYSMSKKRPHWYVLSYCCSHFNKWRTQPFFLIVVNFKFTSLQRCQWIKL